MRKVVSTQPVDGGVKHGWRAAVAALELTGPQQHASPESIHAQHMRCPIVHVSGEDGTEHRIVTNAAIERVDDIRNRLRGDGGVSGSLRSHKCGIQDAGMNVLARGPAIAALASMLFACEASGPDAEMMVDGTTTEASETGGMGETSLDPDVGEGEPQLRCPTPPGHTGSPQSIEEAVAHIQALPDPVDVPCVLESFARPLSLLASSSPFSAQPARGDANPRLFVFFDGLILSFATTGHGATLVEFAEFVGPTTTVKGELEFPLDPGALETSAVFAQVRFEDGGTNCRFCHRNEVPADPAFFPDAFASDALAAREDTILDLEEVRLYADNCDSRDDPVRCLIYEAVFGWGEVVEGAFDPEIQTIFDYD